jgi:hypothetical protein
VYLRRKNNERYANHDDHVQLRRPNVRHEVTISDRGERHHHVIRGLEETQMTMAGPLEMLYAAYASNTQRHGGRVKITTLPITNICRVRNTNLVNTKHSRVADSIINCCDNADCDFCMARCRSFWKCMQNRRDEIKKHKKRLTT